MKICSLKHFGIGYAFILIILIPFALAPAVSADSSYPPDFGLLPGGLIREG